MKLILALIIFSLFNSFQSKLEPLKSEKKIIYGDINYDKRNDKIIIHPYKINERKIYRLQVYFNKPKDSNFLTLENNHFFESQNPDSIEYTDYSFYDIEIKNGIIITKIQLTRGTITHKFKYQNNNFELIGFTMINSNGRSEISTTDYNLNTGVKIEIIEDLNSDKIISKTVSKKPLKTLPKLKNITLMEYEKLI